MNSCLDAVWEDCATGERSDRCSLNLSIVYLQIFKESFVPSDKRQTSMVDSIDDLVRTHCNDLVENTKNDPNGRGVYYNAVGACLYERRKRIIEIMLPVL